MKKQEYNEHCFRTDRDVAIEECYKCFLNNSPFHSVKTCREAFIYKTLKLPEDYEPV